MSETIVKDILGNVSFINMGQSPDSIYYNEEGNGLPLIQGNADIKERKSIKRFYTSQITKVCDEGDILMTVRAPVGYVGVASFQSCVGRGVCSIKANGVDSKYLFYLLIQNEDKWKSLEAGTTFSAVTSKEVYNFPLFLTKSKTEQRQIAKILSTADAVIEKTRAAIAKYKAIKQGMLQDLFTRGIDLNTNKLRPRYEDAPKLYKDSKLGWIPREWEVEEIGNCIDTIMSNVDKHIHSDELKVSLCNYMDVYTNRYLKQNISFSIGSVNTSEYLRFSLQPQDVVITKDSETPDDIAVPSILIEKIENLICGYHLSILRSKDLSKLNGEFIMLQLQLHEINKQFANRANGSTRYGLTIDAIEECHLLVPNDLKEQLAIAERLKAIDNKLQTEQTYLQKMQSIKKGLMEDLLSGRKCLNLDFQDEQINQDSKTILQSVNRVNQDADNYPVNPKIE